MEQDILVWYKRELIEVKMNRIIEIIENLYWFVVCIKYIKTKFLSEIDFSRFINWDTFLVASSMINKGLKIRSIRHV
jgi:hypothetical protein